MQDQKAEIFRVSDPSKRVTCQFNPKDFSITKSVKWVYQTADGKNVGDPEFAGGEAQDLIDSLLDEKTGEKSLDTGSSSQTRSEDRQGNGGGRVRWPSL